MPRNDLEMLLLDTVADALGVERLEAKKPEAQVLILPPGVRSTSDTRPQQRVAA